MSITACQMTLVELLPDQAEQLRRLGLDKLRLAGITIDSRRVRHGDLFLACKGERFNGVDFVESAAEKGACAVLVNQKWQTESMIDSCPVPVIAVPELEQRMPELANRFYQQPSKDLHVIGITGTNGKTSCSHFIAQALNALSSKSAVLGTNGYGFLDELNTASHTTPDTLYLQRMLADMRQQGANNIVMEVSSHALDQKRVAGVAFDQAVFTNLTRDHLDYHGDMAEYGFAKQRLFSEYGIQQAIINLDDPYAAQILKVIADDVQIIGYGAERSALCESHDNLQQIWIEHCALSVQGIEADLHTPWGTLKLSTSIIGAFNLSNLMATVAVLIGRGYSLKQIAAVLPQLKGVSGRMEAIEDDEGRLLVVDYAHTPDALEKALLALRGHCDGQLWCVFGCGGDRDTGKRAQMAAIAETLSDRTVLTSDNPRTENPQKIIEAVLAGFQSIDGVVVESDRRNAIELAVSSAKSGDVVLIAGKGHEDYQEIHGVRHPFSDASVIRELLGRTGSGGRSHA